MKTLEWKTIWLAATAGMILSSCATCRCLKADPSDETVIAVQPIPVAMSAAGMSADSSTARQDPDWWDVPYPSRFDAATLSEKMDVISVRGNQFVNEKGETVIFQGVSIADPDKLRREGKWDRRLFEEIRSFGANVVRIPVHPVAWRGLGPARTFALLDQAVIWATELHLYLIIDWHSIGNLVTEMFQHAIYETTKQETYEFWRAVAFRYQGIPTVAFFELFNEPTVFNGNLGEAPWEEWKKICEDLISIIYSHDPHKVPLVAGFDWAYDLKPVKSAPIQREGIAYVSHPYPQKTSAPYEKNWDETFGFIAEKYPLFVTEIGYMKPDAQGAHVPVMDDGSYGKRMTDYLAQKGASWVAWCFHPLWPPQLISDWNFTPTESGAHFRSVMKHRTEK